MTGREWDADVASYKAAVQDYRRRRFRSNVQTPLLEPVQQHVAATAPRAVPPPTPLPSPPPAAATPGAAAAITPPLAPPRFDAALLAASDRSTAPLALAGPHPLGAHPPAQLSLRPTPLFVRSTLPPPAPLIAQAPPALVPLPPPRVALPAPLAPPPPCQQAAQHATQTVATAPVPLPPPPPLAPQPVAALPVPCL